VRAFTGRLVRRGQPIRCRLRCIQPVSCCRRWDNIPKCGCKSMGLMRRAPAPALCSAPSRRRSIFTNAVPALSTLLFLVVTQSLAPASLRSSDRERNDLRRSGAEVQTAIRPVAELHVHETDRAVLSKGGQTSRPPGQTRARLRPHEFAVQLSIALRR
jgi:hypothetical protein